MSRVKEAKARQGYDDKPKRPMCSNCKRLNVTPKEYQGFRETYIIETKIRCGLGDFAVKKTALCNQHEYMGATRRATVGG